MSEQSTTGANAGRNLVTPKLLIQLLANQAPGVSTIVVGNHGVGKSQISAGVAEVLRERFPEDPETGEKWNWPVFDRRLAQMTEGDLIGIPDQDKMGTTKVTAFLPVDWFQQACDEPCVVVLEELNRAEVQMMQGGFQIVGARELNGRKLHPLTRVISCVNPPEHYQVQEIDKALLDRFAVFWLEASPDEWVEWAEGKLDESIVQFIREHPRLLTHNPGDTGDLEVAPTPRAWHKLDTQLKYANIAPSEYSGRAAPELMAPYVFGIVGRGAGGEFLRWLRNRQRVLTAEDILDNWHKPGIQKTAKTIRHEEILGAVRKICDHAMDNTWTQKQADNLAKFSEACLSGEDRVALFSGVAKSPIIENVLKVHATRVTKEVVTDVKDAKEVMDKRGRS